MDKVVFFLGSGFSKSAGGLVQNDIVRTILDEKFTGEDAELIEAREHFVAFLREELHVAGEHAGEVELEDVLTPIDRCIGEGLSIGRYSSRELVELREEMNGLMRAAVNYGFARGRAEGQYVEAFAGYVNELARRRMEDGEDRVAVVTTNWDTLLDHALKRAIEGGRPGRLSVVDYCCYVSSWEAKDESIKPGLLAVGHGGYNVKLLKLHGSMNWFQCPLCQRMYVRFGEETGMARAAYCRHCRRNYGLGEEASIRLQSNLLLPTFLKNLNNVQLRLVWQNAAIELSEARRVVFIGYSLPAADFEIRQMLTRMIRPDAEIQALIYPYGKNVQAEIRRYKNLFGERLANKDILLQTVPEYVADLTRGRWD